MTKVGILPYHAVYGHNRLFDLSLPLNRDHSLQVWHDFRESCLSLGWEVDTVDDSGPDRFDVYLVLHPLPEKIQSLGEDRLRRSIVKFSEPPEVESTQYGRGNLERMAECCPVVYSFNERLCKEYGFTHHRWYVDLYPDREKEIVRARDRRGVCMIAANMYRRHHSSKLGLRLDLLRQLVECPELRECFDLYGPGWLTAAGRIRKRVPRSLAMKFGILDKVLLRCEKRIPWNRDLRKIYKGLVASKVEVLSRARFDVIIENSYWGGWITEKLFDCFQVGCVPIYFGTEEGLEDIPSSAFINGRSFPDPLDSVRFALSLTDEEVDDMIQAGQEWIVSEDFESKFGRQSFIKRLQEAIAQVAGE